MDKGERLRNQDSHLTLSDGSDKPEFHYSLVSRHNLMLEVVHILLRHIFLFGELYPVNWIVSDITDGNSISEAIIQEVIDLL